jgi:hypothetical protein
MVDANASAEPAAPEREGQSDDVVRVDQVVRDRVEIELREDGPNDVELNAFAGIGTAPANQAEAIAETHGADRRSLSRRLLDRWERTPEGGSRTIAVSFGSARIGQKI